MGASRKVGGRRLAGCFSHALENNLTCSDGDVSIFLARRCCMLALMWKVLWGACGGRVELWFALSISGRDPGLFNLRVKKKSSYYTQRIDALKLQSLNQLQKECSETIIINEANSASLGLWFTLLYIHLDDYLSFMMTQNLISSLTNDASSSNSYIY